MANPNESYIAYLNSVKSVNNQQIVEQQYNISTLQNSITTYDTLKSNALDQISQYNVSISKLQSDNILCDEIIALL